MRKFELFIEGRKGKLSDWDLFVVRGVDRENFLQGQTTNDILSMELDSYALNSRIERSGKIQFFFINIRKKDELLLLIPSSISELAINEINKYIIMDDVEITKENRDVFFNTYCSDASEDSFKGFLYGVPMELSLSKPSETKKDLSFDEQSLLTIETGWPTWGLDVQEGDLLNNTRLNDLAISYTKGCFLGQETVAKVQNGRGASFYPSFLESDEVKKLELSAFLINGRRGGEVISKVGTTAMVKLFREFRIENKEFELTQGEQVFNLKFKSYPQKMTLKSFSHDLYLFAVKAFQDENEDVAIKALEHVIKLDPTFSDAYESLGVIYGRQEKFELGIDLMDRLLAVNESSVMAHTNKSLYLMRLGKIEEAEEEKGLATVKSFAEFGKISKEKKQKEELEKEQEEQARERESMFRQVLEIDADDAIANFGIADISFQRKEYIVAKEHLLKVLHTDEKYSMAYSLLGKTLEVLGEKDEARETYIKGIAVASAKGELMPANEMQARLVKL